MTIDVTPVEARFLGTGAKLLARQLHRNGVDQPWLWAMADELIAYSVKGDQRNARNARRLALTAARMRRYRRRKAAERVAQSAGQVA